MSLEKLRKKFDNLAKVTIIKTAKDISGPKTSPEIQEQRMAICTSCPHLYKPTTTCRKCGCFMAIKTWLPRQSCPIKKWGPDPNFSE